MSDLTQKVCVACEGGIPPLSREESEKLMDELNNWTLRKDAKQVSKDFKFKNFAEALTFANQVGELAEKEGHHPDMHVSWGKVGIDLSTHSIGGLSENDFILAAKIDIIAQP
jgi:4a-hydroxytetrahydrobiopterin dehydratase